MRRFISLVMTFVFVTALFGTTASASVVPQNSDAGLLELTNEYDGLFGAARFFDLVAFGDVNKLTHIEGAVAIQGKYSADNGLSVGTSVKEQCTKDYITFLSGGGIDAKNYVMSCEAGYIAYNKDKVLNLPDYLYEKAQPVESAEFFDGLKNRLVQTNYDLTTLKEYEQETKIEYGKAILDCQNKEIAVFTIKDAISEYEIINIGNAAIINVIDVPKIKFSRINSCDEQKVLFNLYNVKEADISYSEFHGSMLAPKTDIKATNGFLEGNLVCNNLDSFGSYEIHHKPFKDILIGVKEVEEEKEEKEEIITETDVISDSDTKEEDIISETNTKEEIISESDTKEEIVSDSNVEEEVSESDIEEKISDTDIEEQKEEISETDTKEEEVSKTDIISDTDIVSDTDSKSDDNNKEYDNDKIISENNKKVENKEDISDIKIEKNTAKEDKKATESPNYSKVLGATAESKNVKQVENIEEDDGKGPVTFTTQGSNGAITTKVLGATDNVPNTSDENGLGIIAIMFVSSIVLFGCYRFKKEKRNI